MSILLAAIGGAPAASGPTISPSSANVTRIAATTCYANLQYNSSGVEYNNSTNGANNYITSRGNWLDDGAASDVWVERTINSGSLYTDAGSGRLNLGTTRSFGVRDTNSGFSSVSCNLTLDFYDAASGGNLLDSVNVILTANYNDL